MFKITIRDGQEYFDEWIISTLTGGSEGFIMNYRDSVLSFHKDVLYKILWLFVVTLAVFSPGSRGWRGRRNV